MASSSVLIIGAGGLGCPAAIYLAAAGIGLLGIVDYDTVDLSNLHRQILHRESAVGTSKARSACRSIQSLNSTVKVRATNSHLKRNLVSLREALRTQFKCLYCLDSSFGI